MVPVRWEEPAVGTASQVRLSRTDHEDLVLDIHSPGSPSYELFPEPQHQAAALLSSLGSIQTLPEYPSASSNSVPP